jgi:hypothetical protein
MIVGEHEQTVLCIFLAVVATANFAWYSFCSCGMSAALPLLSSIFSLYIQGRTSNSRCSSSAIESSSEGWVLASTGSESIAKDGVAMVVRSRQSSIHRMPLVVTADFRCILRCAVDDALWRVLLHLLDWYSADDADEVAILLMFDGSIGYDIEFQYRY